MKKKHNWLRFSVFIVIAVLLLDIAGRFISIFAVNGLLYWRTADFYREPKDSMDAVVVGSSSTYSYWVPTTAWKEYGVTMYSYSTAQQPLAATRFVIDECRKTQPDAVYVINLNMALVEEMSPARIHFLSDVMPPSPNRHQMIQYLCDIGNYTTISSQLEYYFPIIAMHSRWKRCTSPFELHNGRGCKGSSVDNNFINGLEDVTESLVFTEAVSPAPDSVMYEVDLLLEHLEQDSIKAAFFLSPGTINQDSLEQINYIIDYIRDHGYTVYNGLEDYEDTYLNPETDYFDFAHANVYGGIKFTKWLGQLIIDEFGFTDKRGDPAYASWDEAVNKYDRAVFFRQNQ